jgi:transposase
MEIVYPRVAGADVHKKVIWVAVRLPGERPGERTVTVRRFKTFWRSLQKMAGWLAELGVADAALESTGVYWWPVYHALAQAGIEVCVCNAAHMRSRAASAISRTASGSPSCTSTGCCGPASSRTRRWRRRGSGRGTARSSPGSAPASASGWPRCWRTPASRPASVASRLLGVSGRAMIDALIAGERNPERLADLALGRLRRKTEELRLACDGRFTAAHGQMGRLHPDAYDHLTVKIAELDALVAEAAAPFTALIARLQTIPGIGRRTAEVLVAETGGDMTRFATAARLAARAGLATGGNESAGKRKHAAARKGNRHLRVAMAEAAWATARTRTRPGARFRRLARRFGKGNEKKAAIAVARTLICIAWAVLSRGQDYAEAGEDYYEQRDRRDREHLIRHHQQALARLGYQVTLIPPGDGSPPPSATSQQPA